MMDTFPLGWSPPTPPFPLLPLRSGTLLPGVSMTLNVGRVQSLALLDEVEEGAVIAVVSQRDSKMTNPERADLYPYGVFARVAQKRRNQQGGVQLTVQGLGRVRIGEMWRSKPYWKADGESLPEPAVDREAELLAQALRDQVGKMVRDAGGALGAALDGAPVGLLPFQVAAGTSLSEEAAQRLLAADSVTERLRITMELVGQAAAESELRGKVEAEVRKSFGQKQREAVLREQLRAIRKELGDGDEQGDDEVSRLRQRLDQAELPQGAREAADRELRRLEASQGQGPEANVIRSYLELLADLPWSRRAESAIDLDRIAAQLDEDHYGLEDVKRRILEHMAVLKLSGTQRGTTLCLVGPPGVGKTSLGTAVAEATSRPFARVALGGVRDEAEIRGHRRTYVGALPGRIIHAIRKVGVKNPVLLLDEVDKLSAGWAGWPEAALLEVLDPEQNATFTDHYLEIPFDLSEVMFICTANTLETMSAPLRDRLEVIEISGYTQLEKTAIARRHLVPKRIGEHGIPKEALRLTDAAVEQIVADYTREAGVRQLDREIRRLCRGVALQVARKQPDDAPLSITLDAEAVRERLGKPRFHSEVAERTSQPGVATGLAWTPFGGDILFVETSRMPGTGRIQITGKLGDVMKESARAALSYVRSHADELGIQGLGREQDDLHIHVPAGAVPKDGPSAGVTIFTALASLLSGRRVRSDTAMTGECTLRGRVLPVGGIKAKFLAAHRAGIRRLILPSQNAADLEEVPVSVRADVEVIFAQDMTEVLAAALEPGPCEENTEAAPPPLSNRLPSAPAALA